MLLETVLLKENGNKTVIIINPLNANEGEFSSSFFIPYCFVIYDQTGLVDEGVVELNIHPSSASHYILSEVILEKSARMTLTTIQSLNQKKQLEEMKTYAKEKHYK